MTRKGRRSEAPQNASPETPEGLRIIGVLFFLSGMAGLVYETLWSRMLALLFGTTLPAVTTVLAAFMGGLALGGLVFGRIADGHPRLLRLYGLLEIGVGVCAFLSVPGFAGLKRLIPALAGQLGETSATFQVVRFVVCAVVLAVPATLMGGTLPVLGRALAGARERFGQLVSALYGLNTLGAVLGTLLAGFLLIRFLGMNGAIVLTGIVNVAVGIAAIRLTGKLPAATMVAPSKSELESMEGTRGERGLLLAYGVAGCAALACEVAWSRALVLVLGSSIYAVTVVLATFLSGIALGGAAIGKIADRSQERWQLFAVIEMGIGLMVLLSVVLTGRLPVLFLDLFWSLSSTSFVAVQGLVFLLAGMVMLLPTLLMGAAFPVAVKLFLADGMRPGRGLGDLYFANTVGGIAGAVAAGFVLVPNFGTRSTLEIAAVVFFGVGLWALFRETSLPVARKKTLAVMLAGLASVFVLAMPPWEQILMASGVYLYAPQMRDGFKGNQEFLYFREGLHSLVAVTNQAGIRSLRINGKTDGSTGEDMMTQVLLAELPLQVHEAPRRVLVIGLGTGVTAGAAAAHPQVRVECLEIDPSVVEAAAYFNDVNGGALNHPSVRIVEADARTWLADTQARYDVIISEPSNPWITGVSNLFTLEHFQACKTRLTPGGVMCQWVHSYAMSLETLNLILRTFAAVFPDASLWESATGDFLILGTENGMTAEAVAARIREGWRPVQTGSAMGKLGLTAPEDLLRRRMLDAEGLKRLVGTGDLNTDDRPLVELLSPLTIYTQTHDRNRAAIEAAGRPP